MLESMDLMVFDFDGTLVNSGYDIAASVKYVLKELGLPDMGTGMILSFIGDGVQTLLEKSIGKDFSERAGEAMELFSAHYAKHMLDTTSLYDSVIDVLNHFQEKKKIIITNKRINYTLEMAKTLGITELFEDIIGADSTPYKKPDSRLLYPFLDKFRAKADKTIVIGDGINDILLAKHTGALSCALLKGLTPRDTLMSLNPDFYCEDISELKNIFR